MGAEQKLIDLIDLKINHEYIQIGSHRIHFVVAGSGPPLLLLHGANIGWGAWYPNIKYLSQNFTVYALDLPGCGDSSAIDFRKSNLEKDFVDIVADFIKIKSLEPVSIIGHSLGGWIALKLAISGHKIKSLVLQNSLGFSDYIPLKFRALAIYPLAKLITRTVMKPTKSNMKNFLQSVLAQDANLADEFIEYFHSNVSRHHNAHPFLFLNRLFGIMKLHSELILSKSIHQITCPVLIVAGDRDPLIPFQKIKNIINLFPNAKLDLFQSVGHVPSLEKSHEFNEITLNFLKK